MLSTIEHIVCFNSLRLRDLQNLKRSQSRAFSALVHSLFFPSSNVPQMVKRKSAQKNI